MSVEAITWANRQRTGSSGAKLVLLALANYADEDGYCYPSHRTMASVTEMSRDSIARYLKALEAGGMVEREARFDASGRRTTDMIRLLLSRGGIPADCRVPPSADRGGTPPQLRGEGTPHPEGDLNPQKEPSEEDSPQAPQGAGAGISNFDGEGEEGSPDTQFGVFWAQYGADPTASKAKALRAWARLGAAERAQALALLPRFLDHCRVAKRKICDPATFLGERRWEGLANLPAPTPKAEEATARPVEADPVKRAVLWALNDKADRGEWHFVEQGSDAWEAWRQAFGAAGFGHRWMAGRSAMVPVAGGGFTRRTGRSFPLRYPPKADGSGTGPPDGGASDDEMAEFVNSGR